MLLGGRAQASGRAVTHSSLVPPQSKCRCELHPAFLERVKMRNSRQSSRILTCISMFRAERGARTPTHTLFCFPGHIALPRKTQPPLEVSHCTCALKDTQSRMWWSCVKAHSGESQSLNLQQSCPHHPQPLHTSQASTSSSAETPFAGFFFFSFFPSVVLKRHGE